MAKGRQGGKKKTTPLLKKGHLAFIGGGNMAEALIRGLLAAGIVPTSSVHVSDVLPLRLDHLRRAYRVRTTPDNARAAQGADTILLAVKPQNMDEALRSISAEVDDHQLVVSIAAGVPTGRVEAGLGGRGRVVRVMPNAPALVGRGAAGVAAGKKARKEDVEAVVKMFGSVGRALVVDESQMDAVTGLSGSGPAFVAIVIEALADGGVQSGLPREVALTLATQTVAGTAEMVMQTGEHPARVKDLVASPGGTTIAGIAALEAAGLRGALVRAVEAATLRSAELGRREKA